MKSRHNRLVQACDVLTYFRLKGLRLKAKLSGAYPSSTERTSGVSYSDYIVSHTKPAEKAVLTLNDAIIAMERFQKLWPR